MLLEFFCTDSPVSIKFPIWLVYMSMYFVLHYGKTSRTNRQKFETELVSVWRVFSSPLELSLPMGGLPAEPVVWPSHNNGPVYGGCCGGGGAVTSPSLASCSRFLSALAPFSPLFILSPFIYLPLFRHVRPLGPSAEEPTPQNYNPDVWLCVCEAGCSMDAEGGWNRWEWGHQLSS